MCYSLRVRAADRVRERCGHVEEPVEGHATVWDELGKRLPFDELHGDEVGAALFLDRVDGADIGVL